MRSFAFALFSTGMLTAATASAHVTVEPKEAVGGHYAKLSFRIPHGCGGAATTKVTVGLAAGIDSVKPKVHVGWVITVAPRPDGATDVVWAGGPLPDAYMDEFEVSVKLPAKGETLVFPVVQDCEKGSNRWIEASVAGSEPKFPAPTLRLLPEAKK